MTKVAQERLADVPRMGQVRRQLLEKAQIFYQGFLEERSDDPAVRREAGRALMRVGSIHLDLGEPEQGEQACRNATDIFEKLAADYPDASEYQKEILACYQLLGEALEMLDRVQDAEHLYRRAVSIGERLVADYPDVGEYQGELTGHYNRLGGLLGETGHRRESLEFYRKAVKRQEKLTTNFPDVAKYQLELASYYADLADNLSWAAKDGLVSDRKKGFDEAEQAIRKSIRIIEGFVSAHPDLPSHRAYLASSYGFLSAVLADSDSGRLAEARQAIDKQIGILEKLVDDFPNVLGHQNWLGRAWYNLHYDIAESLEEKEKVIRKAIAIREKMATNFPNVPVTTAMVVESYNTLGDVLEKLGRLEEAEEAYQKAEEIEKEVVPEEER
jgi:tetratricopeptide (TPR) repeat protein